MFHRLREKRWDAKQLIGSGGMPSSHSATVTALAVSVAFKDGFSDPNFATATVLACVVDPNSHYSFVSNFFGTLF